MPPERVPCQRRVAQLPAWKDRLLRAGPEPRRVKIRMTPLTASEPYSAETGRRMISMRSMLSVVSDPMSKDPPGSLTGTPSTSTWM